MSDFEKSEILEGQITEQEHKRAQSLEAILLYDTIVKARQSKQAIMKQIKELHSKAPIKLHGKDSGKPASVDDLKELLGRLAQYDEYSKPATFAQLKTMFEQLSSHYEDQGDDSELLDSLPVTVGDLKLVYDHLAKTDKGSSGDFNGRNRK